MNASKINIKDIEAGKSLLLKKQPICNESLLKINSQKLIVNRNPQKQNNYFVTNQEISGIFKKTHLTSANPVTLSKNTNICENSDISKVLPDLTNLLNLNEFGSQHVNNIFVISSCQLRPNLADNVAQESCNEINSNKAEESRNISINRTPIRDNIISNITIPEKVDSTVGSPKFIENLNENQLNFVTKAVSNTEGDGNFTFWL